MKFKVKSPLKQFVEAAPAAAVAAAPPAAAAAVATGGSGRSASTHGRWRPFSFYLLRFSNRKTQQGLAEKTAKLASNYGLVPTVYDMDGFDPAALGNHKRDAHHYLYMG